MKFKNEDRATITATNTPLDGRKVVVVGVYPTMGCDFYLIESLDPTELFHYADAYWKTMILTEHCLSPIQIV